MCVSICTYTPITTCSGTPETYRMIGWWISRSMSKPSSPLQSSAPSSNSRRGLGRMDSQRLLRVVLIVGVLVKQDIFNLCRDVKIREYNCNCFNRRRDGVSSRRRGIHPLRGTEGRIRPDDSVSEGLPSSENGRGVLLSTLHYDLEACVKRR